MRPRNTRSSTIYRLVQPVSDKAQIAFGKSSDAGSSAELSPVRPNPVATVTDLLSRYHQTMSPTCSDHGEAIRYAIRPVCRILGSTPPEDIGQTEFNIYIGRRVIEGVTYSTIRRELGNLRSALNRAAATGEISPRPKYVLPSQGRPRTAVLERGTIARLISVAEKNRQLHLFVLLALATGGRTGAILELHWNAIDLERGLVDLRYHGPHDARRKGRAIVPIAAEVSRQLADLKPATDAPVFDIGARRIRYLFRSACRKAAIPDNVVPHLLRHTVATAMLLELPIILVSRFLGHSSIATTERVYAHVVAESLRPAANIIGKLVAERDTK